MPTVIFELESFAPLPYRLYRIRTVDRENLKKNRTEADVETFERTRKNADQVRLVSPDKVFTVKSYLFVIWKHLCHRPVVV